MKRIFFAIFGTLVLVSCGNEKGGDKQADRYEKGKLTLVEIETKAPEKFLAVNGKDKKNLVGQTVVKGEIENKAKMVSYKDVELRLRFFSKTGVLLEEDHETVFEVIAPGQTTSFKTKYFAAKGTDSVAISVVKATAVK